MNEETSKQINEPLLRKIQEEIRGNPSNFNMASYFGGALSEVDIRIGVLEHKCGTTACIAGWALALNPSVELQRVAYCLEDYDADDIEWKASNLLGMSQEQASRLFHTDQWPREFQSRYDKCSHDEECQVAIERIEHFIQTNGEE